MFETWRRKVVEPRVFGRVLDVGCGKKRIGKKRIRNTTSTLGRVIGIELPGFGSPDVYANNLAKLPILAESFECIGLLAVINYFNLEDRKNLIQECHRVLTKYGRLIITCTTPLGGFFHHLVRWSQPKGISQSVIQQLVESCGFRLVYEKPFMFWLNHLYVFGKEVTPTENLVQIQKVIKEKIHEY